MNRSCEAIEIPSGITRTLASGTPVRIMQALSNSYTVSSDRGAMYRIDAENLDALGLSEASKAPAPATGGEPFSEKLVWNQLKTIYDPEIPVNIVDLGLVYSCAIIPLEHEGQKIEIKMTMTAPGCGMANVLMADVKTKLSKLPEVKEVHVDVVFDPPWHPGLMSEGAKLQLGFDADYGSSAPGLPILR